jgi:hypothetical protein
MIRRALCALLLPALALTAYAGDDKAEHRQAGTTLPAFEQFKQIAGTWEGKEVEGRMGTDVRAVYRVTSGGSAVVETLFPNSDHEMVTVIHPDGDDLLLTHYCMVGNQPQMKASGRSDAKEVAFKFVRATNLKSADDMHMHDVTYTFVDNDTLRSRWTHYHGGKPAGTVVFELKRKSESPR